MKRKKILVVLPIAAIWLFALIFAGFFDLDISLLIADPMLPFGRFLEIAGEPPAILFTAFNCALIAVYFLKCKNMHSSGLILAALSIIGTVGTAYYTTNATFGYIREWRADLGRPFIGNGTELFLVLLTTALLSALCLIIAFNINSGQLEKLLPSAAHCVLAAAVTLIVIWCFKFVWGRVRFRQLTDLSQFTPFFHPNGFTGYFSFPSGHTANATVILTIGYFFGFIPENRKKCKTLIYAILSVWIVIVALSRVLVGAHYLSDVLCGGAITAAIVYFCRPRSEKLSSKEKH